MSPPEAPPVVMHKCDTVAFLCFLLAVVLAISIWSLVNEILILAVLHVNSRIALVGSGLTVAVVKAWIVAGRFGRLWVYTVGQVRMSCAVLVSSCCAVRPENPHSSISSVPAFRIMCTFCSISVNYIHRPTLYLSSRHLWLDASWNKNWSNALWFEYLGLQRHHFCYLTFDVQ